MAAELAEAQGREADAQADAQPDAQPDTQADAQADAQAGESAEMRRYSQWLAWQWVNAPQERWVNIPTARQVSLARSLGVRPIERFGLMAKNRCFLSDTGFETPY